MKESMKKRLPWLIILLGLGMVVSSVVGIFEKVVTALPIIMCFQSLILDMAGNVGTQSLAVTIRVDGDDWPFLGKCRFGDDKLVVTVSNNDNNMANQGR